MTLDKLLSQMGAGKQLMERFSEYGAPGQEQLFYGYEPPATVPHHVHEHEVIHKYYGGHGGGGGHHKSSAAMSALTLLAFLFFLHILEQCIKDHMTAMNTPQIMIVTGGREGETLLKKSDVQKLDKSGLTHVDKRIESNDNKITDGVVEKLTKINTAEPPKGSLKLRNTYQSYSNKTLDFGGFVSAMDYK
ncbi:uncharacterized protein LOC128674046 isoform X2 [Plodia interpunctella]|uniref:uncharacterized protein LOC128674046 isoform X2 n=1 Tax=Plodia interpunctella TaxID=58824 RepID=UPI002367EAE5|nr:uncharacterized protein LOC128674046 isoform X2 [Plodia interpunctella]